MIISKTPYRISFFGGGTDYPEWYLNNGGEVISSTIDKYLYLTMRSLPSFFEHKYRISYSIIENAKEIRWRRLLNRFANQNVPFVKLECALFVKNGFERFSCAVKPDLGILFRNLKNLGNLPVIELHHVVKDQHDSL